MLKRWGAGRALRTGAVVGGGAAVLAGLAVVGLASYFVRRVVTPEREHPDDTTIRSATEATITVDADEQTTAPGRYGLWLDGGTGHARVGEVISTDTSAKTVTRELLGVDSGAVSAGRARWSSFYYAGAPTESLGLPCQDVRVRSDVGDLPAWLVPGHGERAETWAILVHGRGADREESLRAIPTLHDLGLTSLAISYRNDEGAPSSADGRYSLGLSEWQDVEAAILYAVERGATDVILFGWSMGGAIVLQTLDRSWMSDRVSRVVLDSPAIDWADVMRHQADLNNLPGPIANLGRELLSGKASRLIAGVASPVDTRLADWVARAGELTHPTLLIHSEDDAFVPFGPSQALAEARPDIVTFERWKLADHCREWNVDPVRWERLIREFCS